MADKFILPLTKESGYFEIRLAAFPYKTNQCYNTGIDKISIKGWPYN